MIVVHSILLRTFVRPQGILGKLGGIIMARTNQKCAAWVIDLVDKEAKTIYFASSKARRR